jgi:hypothetical protein
MMNSTRRAWSWLAICAAWRAGASAGALRVDVSLVKSWRLLMQAQLGNTRQS